MVWLQAVASCADLLNVFLLVPVEGDLPHLWPCSDPASSCLVPLLQASDVIKKGLMCSLFINDLDAGAGRMGDSTQYTVNNQ